MARLVPVALLSLIFILAAQNKGRAGETMSAGLTPPMFKTVQARFGFPMSEEVIIGKHHCPPLLSSALKDAGRAVTEFALLCNAVFDSRPIDRIKLIHHLPHRRRLSEIAAGAIDVSATTIFPEGLANVVGEAQPLVSQPVIKIGDFEKAIFTLPSRRDVLAVRTLEQLRYFKAITVKNWRVDVKTLEALGLAGVVKVSKSKNYAKMLLSGRADFTISEFASRKTQGFAKDMVRIEGIKLALSSPRVFPVSPKRPDILKIIDLYIDKLTAGDGDALRKIFVHAGFIKPEFAEWKLINPGQ